MSEINPGWFSLAWQIAVTVVGLGGGIVGMWASLHFARRKEVHELKVGYDRALQEQSTRLTRIEEQLRQAPKHADLVALSGQVAELRSDVSRMEGQAERTNNLLSAIHDYLLNAKE
jgi:poly-gamma-glutamate capsule biosynthesis protein CapA/YwtB (metallophosphatase superfamily)